MFSVISAFFEDRGSTKKRKREGVLDGRVRPTAVFCFLKLWRSMTRQPAFRALVLESAEVVCLVDDYPRRRWHIFQLQVFHRALMHTTMSGDHHRSDESIINDQNQFNLLSLSDNQSPPERRLKWFRSITIDPSERWRSPDMLVCVRAL